MMSVSTSFIYLIAFSLNAFSAAATTLHEAYDAWIMPPVFLRLKKVA